MPHRRCWVRAPVLRSGNSAARCSIPRTGDHGYDLAGKRVAVIGTGASAIQIVPTIASQVGKLHLFQRTAPWVMPRFDRAYAAWERRLLRVVPAWRWLVRKAIYWRLELFGCALGCVLAARWLDGLGAAAGRQQPLQWQDQTQ